MRLQSLDSCFILEMICGDKLKGYGTVFDELCLIMSSYIVKREAYLVPLGRRHRLQLSMVTPELHTIS